MSLADFMRDLQSQDGGIYSEVPEQPVRVIPPEQTSVRVIAPETAPQNKPVKIKLKLNPPASPDVKPTVQAVKTQPIVQTQVVQPVQPKPQVSQNVINTSVAPQPDQIVKQAIVNNLAEPPKVDTNKELTDEELFIKSGTEDSKKALWMDYFSQAKASKKHNPIVDRMRVGRFTITPDNKVLILPDYDVVNKDPDDILKSSWF